MTKRQLKPAKKRSRPPALTPESRENQLVALAMDLAEERMANGTASSQEIVHFLRLGSLKSRIENEKLKAEVELARAKVEVLEAEKNYGELYAQVLEAMTSYGAKAISGGGEEDA